MSSWTVVTVNPVNGTQDELMKVFEDEIDSRTCDTGEIEGSNLLYHMRTDIGHIKTRGPF